MLQLTPVYWLSLEPFSNYVPSNVASQHEHRSASPCIYACCVNGSVFGHESVTSTQYGLGSLITQFFLPLTTTCFEQHACSAVSTVFVRRSDLRLQVSYDDFKEFASLRKELHKLQVALEFYQKTTGKFTLDDLKVGVDPLHPSPPCCPPPTPMLVANQQATYSQLCSNSQNHSKTKC